MKIIYIGSSGPLSLIPLQNLLKSKHHILAVAVDDIRSDFSVINNTSDSIDSFAFNKNIPIIKLNKNFSQGVSEIKNYNPDVIIVSCYARKLPDAILCLPRLGCFNIHPSLLPAYRGPTPLFWQFRNGVENFGITLHRMTSNIDAGKIVSQHSLILSDGLTLLQVNSLFAQATSELLHDMLHQLEHGALSEITQDESKASYYSYPIVNDLAVTTDWTAKRIYNFICANEIDRTIFPCEIDEHKYQLIHAYSYQDEPYAEMGNEQMMIRGDTIYFSCQTGYIQCRFKAG